MDKEIGMGEALINLIQSNAFDRVEQQYFVAVLVAAGFGSVFRVRIAVMNSDI